MLPPDAPSLVMYRASRLRSGLLVVSSLAFGWACGGPPAQLRVVTTAEFAEFVAVTDYLTDAERYGWSVVQRTVFDYEVVEGATWRVPDGVDSAGARYPVTQVSHNDAVAYARWAGARLPSYEEYWALTADDERRVVVQDARLYPASEVSAVGNAWELTTTRNAAGEVRLAGGSYLCSAATCNGTDPDRALYVSDDTGNSHITIAVVE